MEDRFELEDDAEGVGSMLNLVDGVDWPELELSGMLSSASESGSISESSAISSVMANIS